MGLLEVLTIVFVILKVTNVIAWSWWLVFLPIIISAVLYVIIIGLAIISTVLEVMNDR